MRLLIITLLFLAGTTAKSQNFINQKLEKCISYMVERNMIMKSIYTSPYNKMKYTYFSQILPDSARISDPKIMYVYFDDNNIIRKQKWTYDISQIANAKKYLDKNYRKDDYNTWINPATGEIYTIDMSGASLGTFTVVDFVILYKKQIARF